MIRRAIKSRAASVLCRTGMDRLVGSLAAPQSLPLVIGYHRVVEDFAFSAELSIPSMLVSRKMLERQLDWIGTRYRFVDLNELGRRMEYGSVSGAGRPMAAVTFDDGYNDFYEQALPILLKKGIPSAVFVVTGLVGTTGLQAHDKLYLLLKRRLGRLKLTSCGDFSIPKIAGMTPYQATRILLEALPRNAIEKVIHALEEEDSIAEAVLKPFHPLTWEVLDRISRVGVIIGSHTKSHALMTHERPERITDELVDSRAEIEQKLGIRVEHFAYPNGFYNAASLEAVAAAGYQFGYITCTHQNAAHPTLTVPRTLLWENSCLDSRHGFSESMLSCEVNHVFSLVNGCRQRHTVNVGNNYGRL
jgi:peptidoglycan/xylan/chitin deacetylase (PgdA/CDA1 family)